jgi:predicted amidohydrolase/ribosomal protein S18 acetylase RimI-like enzyme
MKKNSAKKISIRKLSIEDLDAVNNILIKTYSSTSIYTKEILESQLLIFPSGQFVITFQDQVVGFCMTMIVERKYFSELHTWKNVTDGGYIHKHQPNGEYLYGVDICVDPQFRGKRVGSRLYDERKKLCQMLGLSGIIFGARMPGLSKRINQFKTPEEYLKAVKNRQVKDPTVSFQMRNGFEALFLLPDYLKLDPESMGYAVLMKWENPLIEKRGNLKYFVDDKDNVKICTINFQQRRIESFLEFKNIIEYFIEVASSYKSDFVVFPEFVTMSLLSIDNKKMAPVESLIRLGEYTEKYIELFKEFSLKYNINIIGGTHIVKNQHNELQNICYVFLRDGSVYHQAKIHPTPTEREWWGIVGGDTVGVIDTDKGKIGILTCYDSEFPELGRRLTDLGAKILFVPFATDTRQGYLRVRYSSMARAIENQCYVVLSGNTGNLPRVFNMDINYGQSSIFTPSDFAFARDGIAAETDINTEAVAIADVSMADLIQARNQGTVTNLKDRRNDLYKVDWNGKK